MCLNQPALTVTEINQEAAFFKLSKFAGRHEKTSSMGMQHIKLDVY